MSRVADTVVTERYVLEKIEKDDDSWFPMLLSMYAAEVEQKVDEV